MKNQSTQLNSIYFAFERLKEKTTESAESRSLRKNNEMSDTEIG